MAAFRADPNPQKIDLGVGVYRDDHGHTPILASVKTAEQQYLASETTKTYVGMAGDEQYNTAMSQLILGDVYAAVSERFRTVQTPGGTGALRVAAEFILRCNPDASLWVGSPTWANHWDLFGAAGLPIREYPYYNCADKDLDADAMLAKLATAGPDDVVLLHACCHNPSGMDPTFAQWEAVCDLALERGFLPLVDMAYQGFGDGLDADAAGVRLLAERLPELIVCTSCSKNFGLYRERIGGCAVLSASQTLADTVKSTLENTVRGIYSMPPHHGAAIVGTILSDPELREQWSAELALMRDRLNTLRQLMSRQLAQAGAAGDFSFIERQKGMFSFLGITPEQVARLRDEDSIYMVSSGRMNVAGISHDNVDRFAEAVARVLAQD